MEVAKVQMNIKVGLCFVPLNSDTGNGVIEGSVEREMMSYSDARLFIFNRSTKKVVWEISPEKTGRYVFKNIKHDQEYFIIGFDNKREYNAVIEDMVKPYDFLQQ